MATNEQYLSNDMYRQKDDGCTAVAAVLIGNRLTVANVGDSRAVLSRNRQGVPPPLDDTLITPVDIMGLGNPTLPNNEQPSYLLLTSKLDPIP